MELKQTDSARPHGDAHAILIEDRTHVRITGVIDVESFHEDEATVRTSAGTLTLWGEGMKLGKGMPRRCCSASASQRGFFTICSRGCGFRPAACFAMRSTALCSF